jgi:microcystin-dependent protein
LGEGHVAEAFLSEIRIFGFNFPPKGWAFCNGQLLPIAQNQALFSLLGTTYGGNGVQNFALPNLQGRAPLHFGNGLGLSSYPLGAVVGQETVTLTTSNVPAIPHTHSVRGVSEAATTNDGTGAYLAAQASTYTPAANLVSMNGAEIGPFGGSQPHPNMQPYLVLNFCICLQGVFPSRN